MGLLSSFVLEIVAATASPGPVPAASPTDPTIVDIRYRAPAECPSERWFIADVLRRIPHVRLSAPGETAPHFDVVVEVHSGKRRASLEFVDADGGPVRRELEADDCAEVVAGIAVVTAVAIDPRLSEREPSVPEPPPSSTAERPPDEKPPSKPRDAPRARSWSFGAHAGAVSDVAPVWVPSAEIFSELIPRDSSLAARLSLGLAHSGELEREGALLRFWLLQGRASFCPWTRELVSGLWLLPCAGIEIGAVHAEAEESPRVAVPSGTTGLWLAAAFAPSLEFELTRALFLELQPQFRVPLLHRTYVLERPPALVHETPAFGVGLFGGFGVRIPD